MTINGSFNHSFLRGLAISILLLILFAEPTQSQILSGKDQKRDVIMQIDQLREGALIVPLFKQRLRFETLQQLASSEEVDQRTRQELQDRIDKELALQEEINLALVRHFKSHYDFSAVYFIEDHQLRNFDPSHTTFLDAETLKPDPGIQFRGQYYFILRYYKASGIASAPEELRHFFLADSHLAILGRPFPKSPDRMTSYRWRMLDLLNISPNTNERIETLVIKLNESLRRYQER